MNNTFAKDIMSSEILAAQKGMLIEDVLKLLVNNKVTGLPVVDKEGVLVGVVSEFDIIKQIADHKVISGEIFQKPMQFTGSPLAISADLDLEGIVKIFVETKVRRLPVVDENKKVLGIITRRDLMRLFYYRARLKDDGL